MRDHRPMILWVPRATDRIRVEYGEIEAGGISVIDEDVLDVPEDDTLRESISRAVVALEDSIRQYVTLRDQQESGSKSEAEYHRQIDEDVKARNDLVSRFGLNK